MKLIMGCIAIKPTSLSNDGKTASGLYVVQTDVASAVKEGVVAFVGKADISPYTHKDMPRYTDVGDRVLFNGNYFTEVTVKGETYYIGKEAQLLAILD